MVNCEEHAEASEHYEDNLPESDYIESEQSPGTIEELRAAVHEKQKLLNLAIGDLAANNDCKYCANIEHCSPHQIERNLAYGGCLKWLWHGITAAEKEVGPPPKKQ